MLESESYDLVLMDIQMPIMDGVTATKHIRAMPQPIRDIPIVAMTGNVLPQQVRSYLDAGMNDHIGKPIERAQLYNNVRRWLPKTKDLRVRLGPSSLNFDKPKLEELVDVVGAEKANRIATKFLSDLTEAFKFKCTLAEAQQEAHALINCAGVLGLQDLVTACPRRRIRVARRCGSRARGDGGCSKGAIGCTTDAFVPPAAEIARDGS